MSQPPPQNNNQAPPQQPQDGRNIRLRRKVAVRVDPQTILQAYMSYADINVPSGDAVVIVNKALERAKPLTKVFSEGESKNVTPLTIKKAFYQYLGTASEMLYQTAMANIDKIMAEMEEARRQNDVVKMVQLYKELIDEVVIDILAMRQFVHLLVGFLNTKLPMSLRSEIDNAMLLGIHFVEGE